MEVTVEIDNKVKDTSVNIYYFKDKCKEYQVINTIKNLDVDLIKIHYLI